MQPITNISRKEISNLRYIFTDIDDTLTTDGKLLPEAYQALWNLQRAGIEIIPITGRCAGWVDHFTRMWPVKAVIGENGAFYSYMDAKSGGIKKRSFLQPEEVRENQKKFSDIKKEVFAKYPDLKVASDQNYREFDLAIDYNEDVPKRGKSERNKMVLEIKKIYEKFGATTKISSIHLNGWFGDYNKLTMAKILTQELFDIEIEAHLDWFLFSGDSPNDEPMFSYFPLSVGVKNVEDFVDQIKTLPKYVTSYIGSLGFAQMAEIILEKRGNKNENN